MQTRTPPPRRDDLDALRGVAMLLGIVLHASLAYFPFPWPVQDPRQAPAFGLLFAVIHGFRMPLFFLLSGFFTMHVLRQRGLRGLLVQRSLRILLPLMLACLTILPLTCGVIGVAVGRPPATPAIPFLHHSGPLDAAIVSYHAALSSPALRVAFAGHSWHLFQTAIFAHLWFLWYLWWLITAFALTEVIGLGPDGRHRWWLVPASCLPFLLMWSPLGPDTSLALLPHPHIVLFYACFFWFGAGTYAREGLDSPLGRRWAVVLPVSLLVLFPAVLATMGDKPVAAIVQPAFAWGASLGLVGLFRRCCSRPSAMVRWLADASYWMYVAHLPIVIALQSAARGLAWPASAKFLAVVAATVAFLLITYRWCVRYTPIGWLLNGRRTSQPA